MDIYDTTENSQGILEEERFNNCEKAVKKIVADLFSYDDTRRRQVIEHYYLPTATFSSPILKSQGIHNIKHIFLVWKTFNKLPPTINNICFNGKTCVVFLKQNLCPRFFPYVHVELPVTVVLEFKETDKDSGLIKIDAHDEHWTIEGIINSIPIISFWYDRIIRTMMGRLLTATGEAVYTATETASLLVKRSKEIEEAKRKLHATQEQDEQQSVLLTLKDTC
ncbi:hypothetical protein BY458DRAFT_504148 [Sporodiniella umbellata]|nr:hypothetical protein BY458DRAFT_504148 [Sporodiniella umbellata]